MHRYTIALKHDPHSLAPVKYLTLLDTQLPFAVVAFLCTTLCDTCVAKGPFIAVKHQTHILIWERSNKFMTLLFKVSSK